MKRKTVIQGQSGNVWLTVTVDLVADKAAMLLRHELDRAMKTVTRRVYRAVTKGGIPYADFGPENTLIK